MRYRSRPQEVEAVQWTGDNVEDLAAFGAPIVEMCDVEWATADDGVSHIVGTTWNGSIDLEAGKDGAQGFVPVPVGHWIVRNPGDHSDYWPVDPDYFAAKYEPVGGEA